LTAERFSSLPSPTFYPIISVTASTPLDTPLPPSTVYLLHTLRFFGDEESFVEMLMISSGRAPSNFFPLSSDPLWRRLLRQFCSFLLLACPDFSSVVFFSLKLIFVLKKPPPPDTFDAFVPLVYFRSKVSPRADVASPSVVLYFPFFPPTSDVSPLITSLSFASLACFSLLSREGNSYWSAML